MEIVKIGRVELTVEEAQKYYEENRYICASYGVFQIFYSNAQQKFYGTKVLDIKGMVRRGRFHALTGEQVNHVLGKEILN